MVALKNPDGTSSVVIRHIPEFPYSRFEFTNIDALNPAARPPQFKCPNGYYDTETGKCKKAIQYEQRFEGQIKLLKTAFLELELSMRVDEIGSIQFCKRISQGNPYIYIKCVEQMNEFKCSLELFSAWRDFIMNKAWIHHIFVVETIPGIGDHLSVIGMQFVINSTDALTIEHLNRIQLHNRVHDLEVTPNGNYNTTIVSNIHSTTFVCCIFCSKIRDGFSRPIWKSM